MPVSDEVERDEELADLYYERELQACDDAYRGLRAAVREGSADALRAALEGRQGFQVGLLGAHGYIEQVVLTEMIRHDAPLELLRVFFTELGGRFLVAPEYKICVFSLLIFIEAEEAGGATNEQDAERRSLLVEAIVRFLVEDLGMPVRMPAWYRASLLGHCKPLLELAWSNECWASYVALRRYIRGPHQHSDGDAQREILQHVMDTPYRRYWARRFVPTLSDMDLEALLARADLSQTLRALAGAEAARRATDRQHMRALLLLQATDDAHAAEREVLADPYLSQFIQQQAFEAARY